MDPAAPAFLIGAPRSGTTLLQRMLGAHSAVHAPAEPHLLTPLAHLGYFRTVDKAPYDHINAAEANRELVRALPRGEADYLDACRAYADTIYQRALAPTGKRLFVDKTPAYALVLDFLERLYPSAGYVVLTRHPAAILHSYAHAFFGGDYRRAWDYNPILARYVPAIARFLREGPASVHVRYEDLVARPEAELGRAFAYLGLPMEAEAVEYGRAPAPAGSFGDPITVHRHDRPVADRVDRWASDLAADSERRRFVEAVVARLDPDDLRIWGYDRDGLWAPLAEASAAANAEGGASGGGGGGLFGRRAGPKPTRLSPLNPHRLRRKVMLGLKKPVQRDALGLGRAVRRVRYYCDVLLRE